MKNPREIYLEACDLIAQNLTADGFEYARSGPHLTRKRGEWTDKILFQSSRHNAAGSVVKLWIYVRLANSAFRKWRKSAGSPLAGNPYIAGAQIGNLRSPPAWIEFNLASASRQAEIVVDATSSVREIGFPFIQLTSDTDALLEALSSREVPGFEPHDAFEFALFKSGRDIAGRVLGGWLERKPKFCDRVIRDLGRLRNPDPAVAKNPIKGAQLARVIAHHDAFDLVPDEA
jgi:hypothetical protein